MKEVISLTPKILELSNSNDIFMLMNIVILSEDVNYNNAQFTSDFVQGVLNNKSDYIGIPFLVNREKLENGDIDKLTHELDIDTGELKTDQIGSFVDFWEEEVDGANCLLGSIKIFKRFPETCSAIIDLVSENLLETSCEVLVQKYQEVSEDGIRKIHFNEGKNALIGSAIVSQGAERRAKPTLLIAEAYQKDIESEQKGVDNVPKEKEYNNGIKVKYHGNKELFSMKIWDIEEEIYNKLNPVDVKNGGRDYNYYIYDLYNDRVIVSDGDSLFSASYKVENKTVILDEQDDWIKGNYEFVPEGVTVAELMEQNTQKITDLEKELNELKEEKETMSKDNKVTVEDLNEKIEDLEKEIADLKEKNEGLEATIVSQKEEAVTAEETVKELNETIDELKTYKEQVETAEKEAKQKELNDRFSKMLDEDIFKSEEVVNAIENLDEAKLNSIVVAQVAKKVEIETNEKSDDVVVLASRQGDLIEATKDASYWSAPKSE